MLYTVMPMERIYHNFMEKQQENTAKAKVEQEGEFREVLLPHGRVVTRRNGKEYVVERLNSTNMGDYLNDEYSPGKAIKK
jgi:hypothetical protein